MFIGDIMQHEMQLKKAWNGEEYDYKKFFKYIKKDLKSVDFCVGNLETVFGGKPYAGIPPESGHDAWRFSSPDELEDDWRKDGKLDLRMTCKINGKLISDGNIWHITAFCSGSITDVSST